jgi:hypothetical protein
VTTTSDEFLAAPADLPEWTDRVLTAFRRMFSERGYLEHEPVPVSARVDPSVRFVGSTISVLKPILAAGTIHARGHFLVQPAVRTHNVTKVDDPPSGWCSYFRALGTLSPADRLPEVTVDCWDMCCQVFSLDPDRVVFRTRSDDHDLLAAVRAIPGSPEIEINGYEPWRYRHRFGVDDVSGRNVNLAVRGDRWGVRDIGNIVLIERAGAPVAVELAFGVATVLSRVHDLAYPMQASAAGLAVPLRQDCDIALADMLSVGVVLMREGVRPNGSNRGRVLRAHLQALSRLRARGGWSLADIRRFGERFHELEYGVPGAVPELIEHYLRAFESVCAQGWAVSRVNRFALHALSERELDR